MVPPRDSLNARPDTVYTDKGKRELQPVPKAVPHALGVGFIMGLRKPFQAGLAHLRQESSVALRGPAKPPVSTPAT